MHIVEFEDRRIECESGENLRKLLLKNGLSPYNSGAVLLNCRGLGSCGTCALALLEGELHPKTKMEKWRLNFPPHKAQSDLRLACQIRVEGDLKLRKHPGFWGEKECK